MPIDHDPLVKIASSSLLEHGGPINGKEPSPEERELLVRKCTKEVLLALAQLHKRKVAHLDLRPETILLRDSTLKLADFGQARRLLRGLITGEISGSPEFVSPEIVRGYPLTLATDMWSVGSLVTTLLTGVSPFHGTSDEETLFNVDHIRYSLNTREWQPFSNEAKHFVSHLLQEIPVNRLTAEEAMRHPWIDDKALDNVKLSSDCLRAFKYQHKWLERRVFVQQTPSEQLLAAVFAPGGAQEGAGRRAPPPPPREGVQSVDNYEHLRIKERGGHPAPDELVARRKERPYPGPPHPAYQDDSFLHRRQYPNDVLDEDDDDRYDPRAVPQPPPVHAFPHPPHPERAAPDASSQRRTEPRRVPLDKYGRLVRAEDLAQIPHDRYGRPIEFDDGRIPLDEFGAPLAELPERYQREFYGRPTERRNAPPRGENDRGPQPIEHERRKLVPQDKGETPSKQKKEAPPERQGDSELRQVPLRMIRGERREIEEEIANRILSDISEEGSLAGSLASLAEIEFEQHIVPPDHPSGRRRSRSESSTIAESNNTTPTMSPVNTVKESQSFFHHTETALDTLPRHEKDMLERAENDPSIPVGAPLFLEGLHNATLIVDTNQRIISPTTKKGRRCTPGTKSPVMLSPGREHSMEVLIAMKRGKPEFLPHGEEAPEIDDDDAHMNKYKKKVKPTTHDNHFKDLQDDLEKDKDRKNDDMDRYRPSYFYSDHDLDAPAYDIDDSPWDSHYQIGPDTYLMATRGATFNSRVRDYRRQLWGDGAPLVRQGFLGYRNQDVTVRERRRYTDILRELNDGAQPKSCEKGTSHQRNPSATAVERIKADVAKIAPSATKVNADGSFAPIFKSRLRDVYLCKSAAILECAVVANPVATVNWQFQGRILENDGRRQIEYTNGTCRLIINGPAAFDLGEYQCVATNEFGTDKTTCRIISGEAPSRPGRPDCELSSDTELFISWEAPEGPTYLEGITYRLEYRLAGPDDYMAPWVVVHDYVDDEAVLVKHLQPSGIYQWRVIARNGFGLGTPSLTSRIVQTHGRGVPKLPVEELKSRCRLNVVTMPQQTTSQHQLEGISEESESDEERAAPSGCAELSTANYSSRFQVEGLLFRGRFSVLREAVDSNSEGGSHCLVKIRSMEDADRDEVMREYEALRKSQHDNVQHLVAAHSNNGFLFLFTERLYEDVFARFIFNEYYTEEQVAITCRQIASALHWIHFNGIIHMDVNPHNVMFVSKRSWIVKLVDFGSAQLVKDAKKPTEFDVQWAAPEMHIDDVAVTVQTDMWGLGIIAFCLLGGFHPFTSEYDSKDEIKNNVLNVKCDPNLIPVNASQEALSFVTWALKKSPLRRMRTDEALSHKFLSCDPSYVRRKESIRYAASRLRKVAVQTKQMQEKPRSAKLESAFGGAVVRT